MTLEIRKAYNENNLEAGVLFNVKIEHRHSNVLPYEGVINGRHSFMNTKSTTIKEPIESFRGKIKFSNNGIVALEMEDYDCYFPKDKEYEDKLQMIQRSYRRKQK